jgi:hypothetical protein
MNSGTSIERAAPAANQDTRYVGSHASSGVDNPDALQPWQLFTLAGLAGATAVVFATRETGPAGVILLSITVGASAWLGLTAWRTLAPLFGAYRSATTQILGGRTRAALEREKTLVLRSLKDLEFDRAMGKMAEKDFAEMSARLRARAAGLLRQLDRGAGYRDEIEKEIARRIGSPEDKQIVVGAAEKHIAVGATEKRTAVGATEKHTAVGPNFSSGTTCVCGTTNEPDARFCKHCGTKLAAA